MYFIKRGETYQSEGRMQNLEESEMIDSDIKNILHTYDIDYTELQNTDAVNYIVEEVKKKLNKDYIENKNDVYHSESCNDCKFYDGSLPIPWKEPEEQGRGFGFGSAWNVIPLFGYCL